MVAAAAAAAVTRRHAAEVMDMSDTKVLLRLAEVWIPGFGVG